MTETLGLPEPLNLQVCRLPQGFFLVMLQDCRVPARRSRHRRTASGRLGEQRTAKRNCTALETLFTF